MNRKCFKKIKTSTLHSVAIVVFVLYALSRSSWGFYIPNSIWSIGIIITCFLIVLILLVHKKIQLQGKYNIILFMVMMLIILLNRNYDIANKGFISGYFEYIYLTIMYFSCCFMNKWLAPALRIMCVLGFFYAVFTIVCSINPSLYFSYIYPMFNTSQWFTPDPSAGFTADYSTNAYFLCMGLIACMISLFFGHDTKIKKRVLLFSAILVFLSLLIVGKRAAILGSMMSLFIGYWNYYSDKPRGRWIKMIGILLLFFVFVYVLSAFIPEISAMLGRIEMLTKGDATVSIRMKLWGFAFESFKKKPWFGYGWRWFKYNNPVMLEYDVHNTVLQILVENGILGALPFFFFISCSYINTMALSRKVRKNKSLVPEYDTMLIYFSLLEQTYILFAMLFSTTFYLRECTTVYYLACSVPVYYSRVLKNRKAFINEKR